MAFLKPYIARQRSKRKPSRSEVDDQEEDEEADTEATEPEDASQKTKKKKGGDVEGLKKKQDELQANLTKALEELTQKSHKLAEIMYAKAQAEAEANGGGADGAGEPGADPSTEGGGADGDVIDAEFEEKKEG